MKRRSILIADDDDDLMDVLQEIFTEHGYMVYKSSNGLNAMELYNQYQPEIALLDIDMPGRNGLDVALEIRKIDSRILIIILTGFLISEKDSLFCYQSGINLFFRKPLSCNEIFACIDSMAKSYYGPVHEKYGFGDFELDASSFILTVNSVEYKLTEREARTFYILLKYKNRLVTLKELSNFVLKNDVDESNTQMLRNTITDLKKKIKVIPYISIESIYAKGYILKIHDMLK